MSTWLEDILGVLVVPVSAASSYVLFACTQTAVTTKNIGAASYVELTHVDVSDCLAGDVLVVDATFDALDENAGSRQYLEIYFTTDTASGAYTIMGLVASANTVTHPVMCMHTVVTAGTQEVAIRGKNNAGGELSSVSNGTIRIQHFRKVVP
jgi:hypothetical protein